MSSREKPPVYPTSSMYRGDGPTFYRLSAKTILYKRAEVLAWMESRACTRTDDVLASN